MGIRFEAYNLRKYRTMSNQQQVRRYFISKEQSSIAQQKDINDRTQGSTYFILAAPGYEAGSNYGHHMIPVV